MRTQYITFPILIVISSNLLLVSVVHADGWRPATKAPNHTSVANTGHNLTQRYSDMEGFMDQYRNDYDAVCVYCHTPHGASSEMGSIPLWNRTKSSATYDLYSAPTTLGQTITTPGANSMTCLSCHDGTVAIDSIINMPGSGGYLKSQETSVNPTFLDSWSGAGPNNGNHAVMFGSTITDCNRCHGTPPMFPSLGMADFSMFFIETDLRNDHPIGVEYPTSLGPGVDFKVPTGLAGEMSFFDLNANGRADTNEIRMYQTGEGYEVECASCHDPHGVPSSAEAGSEFIPSFLRISNAASALCFTCHTK